MAAAPCVLHDSLIPPFVYRLPIPAISLPSTNLKPWQRNIDIKRRFHTVRLLIAARLSADEFLAHRNRESSDTIQEITNRYDELEWALFEYRHDVSAYQYNIMDQADFVRNLWIKDVPKGMPSLSELSFQAVLKEMAVEEKEEFSLQSNSTDAVHDLCRFIYQKARRIPEMRSSQTENS